MSPRKLHQQALYLKPDKADLLDQLSAETRIPKAELLREAVDDLLAKHGKADNAWYADIVATLSDGKVIANHLRGIPREGKVWVTKCEEFLENVDQILASLGRK